jgi:hypothetical protein
MLYKVILNSSQSGPWFMEHSRYYIEQVTSIYLCWNFLEGDMMLPSKENVIGGKESVSYSRRWVQGVGNGGRRAFWSLDGALAANPAKTRKRLRLFSSGKPGNTNPANRTMPKHINSYPECQYWFVYLDAWLTISAFSPLVDAYY